MHILFINIIRLVFINCFLNSDKIIISLTSDINTIQNTKLVINSIIEQNVDKKYFNILLILSSKEFKNINDLPNEIILLHVKRRIIIKFIEEKLTSMTSTLLAMKEYKDNSILIINNKCLLPSGWLKMFIEDHNKYPKAAIVASIQYYFGKNREIKEFTEGFKGSKFGTFNHVTDMIFNFALVNIDLGGILYPKYFFHDQNFYDEKLFLKIINNSEEFWQSAFIIKEDKILRQSSKIFDYTKYLLDDINYEKSFKYKKELFEQIKKSFSVMFPNFESCVKKRQKKIIVSLTSYPKRFNFLPGLMTFIRNQTYHINKVKLFIFKKEAKYYNLSLSDIDVILAEKNLRPHLKYFYAMKLFRNHAIITIDDDIGYTNDTFNSLFNAYLENPNLISGRRSHIIKYKKNGELKQYANWKFQQHSIKKPDFDVTLTNVGASIFPPDILNIQNDFLPIIYETITCDDLTLKYFANLKGIPHKWVFNTMLLGISRELPKTDAKPLYKINFVNNEICLNKLNILINNTILNNLCVEYRNIQTGISIYLFSIHNENKINNKLFFDIQAYSYCPIDKNLVFNITFDKFMASCFFDDAKQFLSGNNFKEYNSMVASCYMNESKFDLNSYYFPKAESENNLTIKIYNYRTHLTTIFRNFICKEINNCILKVIAYERLSKSQFPIYLKNNYYLCNLDEYFSFLKNSFPRIIQFKCILSENKYNISKIIISGIPSNLNSITKIINDDKIPNQFRISRIIEGQKGGKKVIIIIGKLENNLNEDLFNLSINFIYPNLTLNCSLKSSSNSIQSKIYCINDKTWNKKILIENHIAYSTIDNKELLLINSETFIKLDFNKDIKETNVSFNNKRKEYYFIIIINIFALIKLAIIFTRTEKIYIFHQ